MTEKQERQLAEITLINSSLIGALATCCASILQQVGPVLPNRDAAVELLQQIEGLNAAVAGLQPALDMAREELAL